MILILCVGRKCNNQNYCYNIDYYTFFLRIILYYYYYYYIFQVKKMGILTANMQKQIQQQKKVPTSQVLGTK